MNASLINKQGEEVIEVIVLTEQLNEVDEKDATCDLITMHVPNVLELRFTYGSKRNICKQEM